MNPLLQVTRAEILERQVFAKSTYCDDIVLDAIEAYDREGSTKRRSQAFVSALEPLWKMYQKESYVSLFKKFIDMELALETFCPEHSSHVNHVIQEFLFGYNILVNCSHLKREYGFEAGRGIPDSAFGELVFSWMAASLLHDIGYDIEKAPEEENFRDQKNDFWDFMSRRATSDNPLEFSAAGPARRIIQDYILHDIGNIPGAPTFSYVEFENLFFKRSLSRPGWIHYDHGVISAIKYLLELERLQSASGVNYVGWAPNRQAATAMVLHNFRYKDCGVSIPSTNRDTLTAYLLIVCDEIQEWERERSDADAEMASESRLGKNARKSTQLVGVTFREERASVTVNHRLKDQSLREGFERYLSEQIVLQKKHYPVKVMFPRLEEDVRREIKEVLTKEGLVTVMGLGIALAGFGPNALLEVVPRTMGELAVSLTQLSRLRKIANATCEKSLLQPVLSNPIYEVRVNHVIEGDPYLCVVFPF